jgi:hypothetical protein
VSKDLPVPGSTIWLGPVGVVAQAPEQGGDGDERGRANTRFMTDLIARWAVWAKPAAIRPDIP